MAEGEPGDDTRPLFGGAIKAAIPASFLDASQVRQVPDNEEVFVDVDTDQSLIIEILEREDVTDEAAARYFFEDLAESNDAQSAEHHEVEEELPSASQDWPRLPAGASVVGLVGRQAISKFREAPRNDVRIFLAAIRLPSVSTDILITLNAPVQLHPESSSARSTIALESASGQAVRDKFMRVLTTFEIQDMSLFGAGR